MSRTIYTIGTLNHECFGHGDYADVASVRHDRSFGDKLPPCFTTRDRAMEYLNSLAYPQRHVIMELQLEEK